LQNWVSLLGFCSLCGPRWTPTQNADLWHLCRLFLKNPFFIRPIYIEISRVGHDPSSVQENWQNHQDQNFILLFFAWGYYLYISMITLLNLKSVYLKKWVQHKYHIGIEDQALFSRLIKCWFSFWPRKWIVKTLNIWVYISIYFIFLILLL